MLDDVTRVRDTMVEVLGTITTYLLGGHDAGAVLRAVTDACPQLLGIEACGILLADPRGGLEVAAASDERSGFLELLQSQLDQGPCIDCVHADTSVHAEDLRQERRWPDFVPAAIQAGYLAVHAIPMLLDGHAVGGLNLFHSAPRTLSDVEQQLAQSLADLAVLGLIQESQAPHRAARLAAQTIAALNDRVVIGQAVGMVAATVEIDADEARALLERHADAQSCSLSKVARDVTDGRLPPAALSTDGADDGPIQ
jgi:GAF domain-containing protein